MKMPVVWLTELSREKRAGGHILNLDLMTAMSPFFWIIVEGWA